MQKWQIGDVTVTKIVESELVTGLEALIPRATRAAVLPISWLKPHFITDDGDLKYSFHALVIETPARRILVDACVGNDKPRPSVPFWDKLQLPFLRELERSGVPSASIDTVLCTHLHVDHVGWNTMRVDGRWVPTFPKARYLMGRTEFNYWRSALAESTLEPEWRELQAAVLADSVQPVFDAGLVDLVETDHRVCDEVVLSPTLGHTPGHVSVRISSQGEEAWITGDFVHHPCQLAHPDWGTIADYDQGKSTRTRQRVFSSLAGTPALVIGTHWTGATAGHIVRDGDAFRLVALDGRAGGCSNS